MILYASHRKKPPPNTSVNPLHKQQHKSYLEAMFSLFNPHQTLLPSTCHVIKAPPSSPLPLSPKKVRQCPQSRIYRPREQFVSVVFSLKRETQTNGSWNSELVASLVIVSRLEKKSRIDCFLVSCCCFWHLIKGVNICFSLHTKNTGMSQ